MGNFFNTEVEPPQNTGAAHTPLDKNELLRTQYIAKPKLPAIQELLTAADDWRNTPWDKTKQRLPYGLAERLGLPSILTVVDGPGGIAAQKEAARRTKNVIDITPAYGENPDALNNLQVVSYATVLMERRPLKDVEREEMTYNALMDVVGDAEREAETQRFAVQADPEAMEAQNQMNAALAELRQNEDMVRRYAEVLWYTHRGVKYENTSEQVDMSLKDRKKGGIDGDYVQAFISDKLKKILGPDFEQLVFARQVDYRKVMVGRDLGILDSDPVKEGTWVREVGKYSPVMFLNQQMASLALKEQVSKELTAPKILRTAEDHNLTVERAREEREKVTQDRYAQLWDMAMTTEVRPGQRVTPLMRANGAPLVRMEVANLFGELTRMWHSGRAELSEAQRGTAWESVGKFAARASGVPEEIARDTPDIFNNLGNILSYWLANAGDVANNIRVVMGGGDPTRTPAGMKERLNNDIRSSKAFQVMSPEMQAMVVRSFATAKGRYLRTAQNDTEEFAKAQERLGKALRGTADEKYTVADMLADGAYTMMYTVGHGATQGIVEVVEDPALVGPVLFGERVVEPAVSDFLQVAQAPVKSLASRMVAPIRFRNRVTEAAKFGPEIVARMTEDVKAAAHLAKHFGSPEKFDQAIGELNARTKALIDAHDANDPSMVDTAVKRYARQFERVLPYSEDIRGVLGDDFAKFIGVDAPRSLVSEVWQAWQGKIPAGIKKATAQFIASNLKHWTERIVGKALGADVVGDDYLAAVANYRQAQLSGNSAKIKDAMDNLVALGTAHPASPGHANILKWAELERTHVRLRKRGIPASERGDLQQHAAKLAKEIMKDQLPSDLDMLQLRVLDDSVRRPGKSFWDNMQRLIYKVSGKKLFSHAAGELWEKVHAARRLFDYYSQNVGAYYSMAIDNGMRRLRLDHVYRYLENKIQDQIDDLLLEDALAKFGGSVIARQQSVGALERKLNQIQNEHRTAVSRPTGVSWNPEQSLAWRNLSARELHGLMKDDPILWENVNPDEFIASPRHNPLVRPFVREQLSIHKDAKKVLTETTGKLQDLEKIGIAVDKTDHPTVQTIAAQSRNELEFYEKMRGLTHDLTRMDDALVTGEAAITGGMKSTKPAEVGKSYRDHIKGAISEIEAQGNVSPETAEVMRRFTDLIPDRYWTNRVRLRFLEDPDGDQGWFSPMQRLIALTNAEDPSVFFHEVGHAILHLSLDVNEMQKLWKIFNETGLRMSPEDAGAMWKMIADEPWRGKNLTNSDTIAVINQSAPYWDQFTEWFAGQMEYFATRQLTKMSPAARQNYSLFRKALQRIRKTFVDWFEALRSRGVSAPAEQWFDDFFAGRTQTAGFDLSDHDIMARETWFKFQREMDTGVKHLSQHVDPVTRFMVQAPMEMDLATIKKLGRSVNKELRAAEKLFARGPRLKPADYDATRIQTERNQALAAMRASQANVRAALDLDLHNGKVLRQARDLLRGNRYSTELEAEVARIKEVGESQRAIRQLNNGMDVFSAGMLPFWEQIKVAKSIIHTSEANAAVEATKLDQMAGVMKHLNASEKKLLGKLIEAGGNSDKLPAAARRALQELRSKPYGEIIAKNLTDLAQSDSAMQARMIETAHESGLIDDGMYAVMRRAGYNPHLYGIFERPKAVASRVMQKVKENIGGEYGPGKGSGPVSGIDGSELMFARDLTQWRVRVNEADGYVHDKTFPTRAAAERYLHDNFDDEILARKSDRSVTGRAIYKTLAGDDAVLADPIGPEAQVLDLLTAKVIPIRDIKDNIIGWREVDKKVVPEARWEAFNKLNRDIHVNRMLNALREFGLVLTPDEHASAALVKAGKEGLGGFGPFAEEYKRLPEARSLGNLSGHYVHHKVLSMMNDMTHTHDQLRAWVDSLTDMYNRAGVTPLADMMQRGKLTRFITATGRAVKHNQILLSMKTWAANILGNFMFSNIAAGPKIMDPRNVDRLVMAAADVFGGRAADIARYMPSKRMKAWALERRGRKGSVYLDEAIRHRVINGALFERLDNPNLKRMHADLAGMEDTQKLLRRKNQVEHLLAQKKEAMDTGQHTRNLQVELVALEQGLQHATKGHVKRIVEWLGGTFGWIAHNKLGLPTSGVADLARSFYGKVDDFFKLATYINLREDGMPAELAAWHIRSFMQDYANVPAAVRALGQSPFGSLVPSFGYEMGRIFYNSIRYKPHRVASIFGAVGAVNLGSAAGAGLSWDRINAMQEATGRRSWIEKGLGMATTLQLYDPYSKDMWLSVDLGDSVLPLFQFVDTHSAVSRAAETMFDRQDRTALESAAAIGMKIAGGFFGSQPVMNWAASAITQRDPVTGKRLVDEDLRNNTLWDWTRAFHRVVTQSFIPPALPGGRDFGELVTGLDQPVHPDTGKTMGGRSPGTTLINALSNIKVRGWPAELITSMLGGKEKQKAVDDRDLVKMIVMQADTQQPGNWGTLPIYGLTADRRRLWARMMNEEDPETKEKLRMEMRRTFDEEDKFYVAGQKGTKSRTAYEQMMALKALEERGVENHFNNLQLYNQTMALIAMDAVGVHPTTFQTYRQLAMTSERREQLTAELERDPYMVQQCLRKLDAYLTERPAATEKFALFRSWLEWAQERAYGVGLREMYKYERTR